MCITLMHLSTLSRQLNTKDDLADMTIKSWFGKGIAKERKEMLKNEV